MNQKEGLQQRSERIGGQPGCGTCLHEDFATGQLTLLSPCGLFVFLSLSPVPLTFVMPILEDLQVDTDNSGIKLLAGSTCIVA